MELELVRTYGDLGTNGKISNGEQLVCSSIELPWKDNQHEVSCIPEGRYELLKRINTKFKAHLILKDVPNRAYILIHPANNALKELKGCIAPVTGLTGPGTGTQSKAAFDKLMALVFPALDKKEKVFITIKSNKIK